MKIQNKNKDFLKFAGIYCIYNTINHKYYIGSSINIKRRLSEHCWLLNNNKHNNIILQRAWNKYGVENFEYLILNGTCTNTVELLEIEQSLLDTLKPEYNILKSTSNTRHGIKNSKETSARISKRNRGHKYNQEQLIRRSLHNGRNIEITQYDLQMNPIKTFRSKAEAAKVLNLDVQGIHAVCMNRWKQYKKFIFKITK